MSDELTTKEKALSILRWMREPDYAEEFSLQDLTDWMNRRPISEMGGVVNALQPQGRADAMSDDFVKRLRDAVDQNPHRRADAMSDETVPKEFNDANIRAARKYKARAEAAEAEIERLRAALEHIRIVCEDNEACDLLGRSLALKFVLGIAERALRQPPSEG